MADATYVAYRVGRTVAGALPDPLLFSAAWVGGTVAARIFRGRRRIVSRNLSRVVGPESLSRTVDDAFRSYARYWAETLRVPKPGVAEVVRRTSVEGTRAVEQHVRDGRGVLFVTGHIGNWDLAGAWVASLRGGIATIAERLEPPELYEMFVAMRRAVGVDVHPLGEASSAAAILRTLRDGGVVALVADRDLFGGGVEVDFFGEPTKLPAGPATLAIRTGALVVAGTLYHAPRGRYHGVMLEPIVVERGRPSPDAVRELTGRIAQDLERLIRRAPGQWHMFQPNWPSDPGYRAAV